MSAPPSPELNAIQFVKSHQNRDVGPPLSHSDLFECHGERCGRPIIQMQLQKGANMADKILQLAAILLTAIALVPAGAHLFAMPNKIDLGRDAYFTVQAIYLGWWRLGLFLLAAIVVDIILAVRLRGTCLRGRSFPCCLIQIAPNDCCDVRG
jgi:hypothetical protein